ncbi:MAG: hypothetical protein HDS62_06350 [Bacteroidales bacterium]|nr:hypothetical protein [Bacteroidales bacterium]
MESKNDTLKNRVAILGCGELGLQAAHYLRLMNNGCNQYSQIGWIDDVTPVGSVVAGLRVIGKSSDTEKLHNEGLFEYLFVAIGYNHLKAKKEIIERFKNRIPMLNIIAPSVYVDPSARLGENLFFYPGAIIDKEAVINDGVILNLGSIVAHNSTIGMCSFLAPKSSVAGFSKIGNCSFIGTGATVIDNIELCDSLKIGAGAVIVKDISVSGTYLGIPATLIK